MFTWAIIAVETVSAVGLVFLVLCTLGAAGVSRTSWWSMGAAATGSTVVERNLDRITIAVALVFTFATLTLDLRLQ